MIDRIPVAILVFAISTSGAFAAPAQLYGKSVVVSWTENRMQSTPTSAAPQARTASGQLSVYVSDKGRAFSEGEAELSELTRRGGFGSFTGILTYKNAAGIRAAAKGQGLARLMVETDAPYLTPMPHRGKPNEPAFLRHTAEYAATNVFGVGYDELAAVTTANARKFFRI